MPGITTSFLGTPVRMASVCIARERKGEKAKTTQAVEHPLYSDYHPDQMQSYALLATNLAPLREPCSYHQEL